MTNLTEEQKAWLAHPDDDYRTDITRTALTRIFELETIIAKALEVSDSIKGTYKHPDELEYAVNQAFVRMVEILRAGNND